MDYVKAFCEGEDANSLFQKSGLRAAKAGRLSLKK
jgi:hypothetical protein